MPGLLTRKAVLLAEVEITPGTDPTPDPATDAVLVSDPDYSIDPNVLTRDFASDTLSPKEHVIGRKLATMTFTHELRGSGAQHSGSVSDRSILGILLRGCGFAETGMATEAAQASTVIVDDGNATDSPAVTWVIGGTDAGITTPVLFTMNVTLGGASATAEINNTNNNAAEAGGTVAAVAVTSGSTGIALGTTGFTATPTWSGSLVINEKYHVLILPTGIKYLPISTGQETLTLYMYLDGILHIMTYAMGTFTINATAGEYATVEFTFIGQYVAPTDVALPSPTYETSLPSQVELSNLTQDEDITLIVGDWTFDMQNEIVPRPDVNGSDGFTGVRLVNREPVGTYSPEMELVADNPFWADFAAADAFVWVANVGTVQGNTVTVFGPNLQVSGAAYGDRDGLRTLEQDLGFKGDQGDDEVQFFFI